MIVFRITVDEPKPYSNMATLKTKQKLQTKFNLNKSLKSYRKPIATDLYGNDAYMITY